MTLPLLQMSSHGNEWSLAEAVDHLTNKLSLSEEDVSQMLESGTQTRFYNRVTWAATRLQRAGLLQRPARGRNRITERGHEILRNPPERLTDSYLMQFQDFREFKKGNKDSFGNGRDEEDETPEEQMESAHKELRDALGSDLLDRIKKAPPEFFETLVIDLLLAMGYGGSRSDAGQAVGRSGDGGIDGVIKEDRLGLDNVYVQAKRWESTVGRPVLQAFAGSLEGARATKGVMLTTSTFSSDAKDYVNMIQKRIVLIDGPMLARLMIEHNIGVTVGKQFVRNKIDSDSFEPETI